MFKWKQILEIASFKAVSFISKAHWVDLSIGTALVLSACNPATDFQGTPSTVTQYVNDLRSSMYSLRHRTYGTTPSLILDDGSSSATYRDYPRVGNTNHYYADTDGFSKQDASPGGHLLGIRRMGRTLNGAHWNISNTGHTSSIALNSFFIDGALRQRKICGLTGTTAERIASCAEQNGATTEFAWDGALYGNGPEGKWVLVSVMSVDEDNDPDVAGTHLNCSNAMDCREVWQDSRTGYLWSDRLGDLESYTDGVGAFRWCSAAGVNETAHDPGSPGQSHYAGLNCTTLFPDAIYTTPTVPVSLCYENSAVFHTPTGHNVNTAIAWSDAGPNLRTISAAKGGMSATSSSSKIHWRLPTHRDWMLAVVNGADRVLPNTHYGVLPTGAPTTAMDLTYFSSTIAGITKDGRDGGPNDEAPGMIWGVNFGNASQPGVYPVEALHHNGSTHVSDPHAVRCVGYIAE